MDTPSVKKPPKTYAETPPNIYTSRVLQTELFYVVLQ